MLRSILIKLEFLAVKALGEAIWHGEYCTLYTTFWSNQIYTDCYTEDEDLIDQDILNYMVHKQRK